MRQRNSSAKYSETEQHVKHKFTTHFARFLPRATLFVTLPPAISVFKALKKEDLVKPGQYKANRITVLVHALGSLTLAIGFVISGLSASAT